MDKIEPPGISASVVTALSNFIELHSASIGLLLLLFLLAGFVLERFAPVVIAIIGVAAVLVLGFAGPAEMLDVFGNPAPIAIGALFILSGALVRTGAIDAIIAAVTKRAEARPRRTIAELLFGTIGAAAFVNNTPVVIILVPVVRRLAQSVGRAATRLLIPLSYVAILGGTLTLIGTSTNLIVDGVAQELGEPAFGIFEISGVGLITALGGVLALALLGPLLLPDRPSPEPDENPNQNCLSELTVAQDASVVGRAIGEIGALKPSRVRIIALRRDNVLRRGDLETVELQPGDRLIVSGSPHELIGIAGGEDFIVGIGGLRGGADLSEDARPADAELFDATIAPSHPSIGRQLAEIPLLSRLPVRILAISRGRHLPGPDLRGARIRAADTLLIAARREELQALRDNVHLLGVSQSEARPFRRDKAPIVIAALGGAIVLAALGVLPIALLAIIAVAVVLATRCIDPEEAWAAIDGNVLVLIFAMLAIGAGLQNAGSVDLIVDNAIPWIRDAPFFVLLLSVYLLTSLLTELVTNNAVAVVMTPVVIGIAEQLGIDARPLLVALMFAASASFATPVGYQTNTIVYAAADYKFVDFLKIGMPMNLVVGLFACAGIYWLFPG
ncbi:SLC13 family permease [Sphingosinicella sp. CPCC 101087]|uniref:SLC13 family permease n=1 Tax=Sphingosinicella sp. CPCC 101087 TaxID=2497754 RepID=UPI00101C52EA|nr:SLC13 family permease [Sphingosinicella sp. CPCC 101087]